MTVIEWVLAAYLAGYGIEFAALLHRIRHDEECRAAIRLMTPQAQLLPPPPNGGGRRATTTRETPMCSDMPDRTPDLEWFGWATAADPPDVELIEFVRQRLNEWNSEPAR